MRHVYDDGGRAAAGFRGHTGDCVCRAVVIASGRPYREVYDRLAQGTGAQRASVRTPKRTASARDGVNVRRKWFKDYMTELGARWTPTMLVGQGCRVHLHDGELPGGRLVVQVSKHYTCVVDGVIHDTHDSQREVREFTNYHGQEIPRGWMLHDRGDIIFTVQRRCVYGYWTF